MTLPASGRDLEPTAAADLDDAPGAVGARARLKVSGMVVLSDLSDVAPEVEAVLSVEAALVAASRVLVEHIGEAEAMKELGRGKAEQDGPAC